MIRAALALHEATGEHAYLERALAWQARARPPLRQSGRPAAISSPPTTPKAWWCGRAPPPTTRRPTPTRSPRRTWSGSPPSPASTPGATRPTACSTASLAARRREPVRAPGAAQRARPAAARGRDRGRPGEGARADALLAAALQAAVPRPHRAARAVGRRAAGVASGAGEDRGGDGSRGLRLRRRDLLAAGDDARCDRRGRRAAMRALSAGQNAPNRDRSCSRSAQLARPE